MIQPMSHWLVYAAIFFPN